MCIGIIVNFSFNKDSASVFYFAYGFYFIFIAALYENLDHE